MSPLKKKAKLVSRDEGKRSHEPEVESKKRQRCESSTSCNEDKQVLKRKNFIKACEKVSFDAFLNYQKRFNLLSQHECTKGHCSHQEMKGIAKCHPIPKNVQESFEIELKSNAWWEALDVCSLRLNSTQYLPHNMLQDIVEIILNAHEDSSEEYNIPSLLDRCQRILSLNYNLHPPCSVKSIRQCYKKFLTSPMNLKENTFTNRAQYDSKNGIVKYCFTRLEAELSPDSSDDALVDTIKNTPEDLQESVQGFHWQKEKFQIYETLDRPQRIERLLTVLESLLELLTVDLTIWHSRYTNNLGSHILRSHKPLMAQILWSQNVLYTGTVTNNCRQIMRLFAQFIHLQYPEKYLDVIGGWLNTMIQTFYICENNSNSDYPSLGKYCCAFANEFYKILSEMPSDSLLRIIERIQPSFMRYLISKNHLGTILPLKEKDDNIIKIFIHFIQKSLWNKYPSTDQVIVVPKHLQVKCLKPNKLLKNLSKQCIQATELINHSNSNSKDMCPKLFDFDKKHDFIDQKHIVLLIYICFHAYLDAFNVQSLHETWNMLNDQLELESDTNSDTLILNTYSVSEIFVKQYRSIYQILMELVSVLDELKSEGTFPDLLKIFGSITLLGL